MARSHGKVLVDIWIDPDFITLTQTEQWCYLMLLSQPGLSLVGCVDYAPHRWATLAEGLTRADVDDAMGGLEDAGFVCIDRTTRELLVRSMTRHDGLRTKNPKLMKGLWGHWKSIASAPLRKVAVDNMPEVLFETPEAPAAALQLRRSERTDWAIAKPIGTAPIDESNARTALLPPSTIHRPPSAVAQSPVQPTPPVDFEHHPVARIPEQLREQNLIAVAALKANRGHR